MKRFLLRLGLVVVSGLAAIAPASTRAQSPGAADAPSQAPLISRTGGGVAPNVMLTLDSSNSMRFQHMPENSAVVGAFVVTIPVGQRSIRFHPDDNGPQANYDGLASGVIPGQKESADMNDRPGRNRPPEMEHPTVLQAMLRSPDVNSVYYNPEVHYRPWMGADGTRMAEASFTAARVDPMGDALTRKLNLSNTVSRYTARWCDGGPAGMDCVDKDKPFNPALVYRLRKVGNAYLDPSFLANYTVIDINASGSFTRHPGRTDCAGTTCTQAEERQNFANWFVYHRSRLLLAKAGVGEALSQLDNVMRLGYGYTDKAAQTLDGIADQRIVASGVRDFTPQRRQEVLDWLYGLQTQGATPLRLALQEVGRYYTSKVSTGPWSDTPGTATDAPQQACRRAYQVLVTDGYWNDKVGQDGLVSVGNTDGSDGPRLRSGNGKDWQYIASRPYQDNQSDTLADYAMSLWRRDLRPDLDNKVVPSSNNPAFWQSLTHFMVGLGVRGTLDPRKDLPALQAGTLAWTDDRIDDLWHAALNSRGDYFSASDAGQLTQALTTAMRTAIERELVEAGVATASATLEAGNRKYIPRYKTATWSGDLEAFGLSEQGLATARLWSARDRLPAWRSRNIVTWDPGQATARGVAFDWASLSAAYREALPPDARSAAFVNFIRGDRSGENASTGLRVREHVLGDFINSTPVFVRDAVEPGHASLPGIGDSYRDYAAGVKARRTGVLYIGANDGMLHAFRDTRGSTAQSAADDGTEVLAYVPRAVLPQLPRLAQRTYGSTALYHQYFVDGPLSEADVHVKAPGAVTPSWRNYLFGTTGAGGRAVFALDVTDPAALGPASVRWEVSSATEAELGYVTAPVAYGRLPGGKWVALFGNGYGGSTGQAYLFVVDVDSGQVQRLAVGTDTAGNGLGGVVVRKSANGEIEALYAGDLKGNLWRLDPAASADALFVVGNGGKALFTAATGQPFVQAPLVYSHPDGGVVVVGGTGRLLTDRDGTDTTVQAVYAVRDTGAATTPTLGPADLAARKLAALPAGAGGQVYFDLTGDALEWSRKPGWSISLAVEGYEGLRVTYPLQDLGQRVILVSAVAPAGQASSCDTVNGKGINLLVPLDTGLRSAKPLFDTNGDGLFTALDVPAAGYATAADGADRAVRVRPQASSGGGGGGGPEGPGEGGSCAGLVSLQNATGQTMVCLPTPPPLRPVLRPIQRRVWSRILTPPF